MASLVRRGKKWYVAWRENGEQRRKALDTESKVEARKLLEVWHREAARDRLRSKTKNPTVAEFQTQYTAWARHHLKQKTRDTQAQRWRDFILWYAVKHRVKLDAVPDNVPEGPERTFLAVAANIRMGDIDDEIVERFKLHLLDGGLSKTTANNYMRDISARFGRAIKLKAYSGPNPCAGVERLKQEESPPPYLTVAQRDTLIETAEAHSQAMHWFCLLGAYEGLRLGEIVNVQWQWFDWAGKLLNIPSDEAFSTKSHKGRSIPLHPQVIAVMQPHALEAGYVFEAGAPRGKTTGAWLYRWNPKRQFVAVTKAAGLAQITPHWLRHTFGTLSARAGISIYKIREWMGHADVKTTKIYANVQGYDEDITRL